MAEPVCTSCEKPWSASLHWPGVAFEHEPATGVEPLLTLDAHGVPRAWAVPSPCTNCETSFAIHAKDGCELYEAPGGQPQQGEDLTVRQQASEIVAAALRDRKHPNKAVNAIEALVRDRVAAAVRSTLAAYRAEMERAGFIETR